PFWMTPSAVSKLGARREGRLRVRLSNRSTHRLQLTPEGTTYYDRVVRILDGINGAEREAAIGATPQGRLRINTHLPFGLHRLLPLIPAFLVRYPGISVDIALTDTVIDLLEERADVAIRVGPLRESRLLARKLGESPMVVVASPAYPAQNGTPQAPADLAKHNLVGFCFSKQFEGWPFLDGRGGLMTVPPIGNVLISDGEAMQQ